MEPLNDQFEATLNAIYVKDAMQGFTGKVAFRWWGAQKPVTLSAPEDTHTVVIMPIHTIR